jgi:hypothetical protein
VFCRRCPVAGIFIAFRRFPESLGLPGVLTGKIAGVSFRGFSDSATRFLEGFEKFPRADTAGSFLSKKNSVFPATSAEISGIFAGRAEIPQQQVRNSPVPLADLLSNKCRVFR